MFKFLIIAGGLFYLYRLVMKPNAEIDSTNHNEEIKNSNTEEAKKDKPDSNDDIEYTDYEEIE